MKKTDQPAVAATLAQLDAARERVCRGTAAVERVREGLANLDDDEWTLEKALDFLAAAADMLYEGAAALQTIRPIVLDLVDGCEMLQGELRRQLRAGRREAPDGPPFPDGWDGCKKPG
jgi:hypothetical protein